MKIFASNRPMKLRARFDLLTSFRQGKNLLTSGTMQFKLKCLLSSTHQKLQVSCTDIFWFFLKDEDFVSKTINGSNIDLDKFPASKVRQLAKKMESAKSTTRPIIAIASDPQAAQVNLMRHQRTYLPPSKSKWKQHSHKSKSKKRYSSEHKNHRSPFMKV